MTTSSPDTTTNSPRAADLTTTRLLMGVLALQVITLGGLWAEGPGPGIASPVHAQTLNPGDQRQRQTDELRQLNQKMDRLLALLAGGQVRVRTEAPTVEMRGDARGDARGESPIEPARGSDAPAVRR